MSRIALGVIRVVRGLGGLALICCPVFVRGSGVIAAVQRKSDRFGQIA